MDGAVTKEELNLYGTNRYGRYWLGFLATEVGYNHSTLWKMANGKIAVSERLESLIRCLPLEPTVKPTPKGGEWRDVPSLNGEFQATDEGLLCRIKRNGQPFKGLLLRPRINKHGYPQVAVTAAGRKMWIPVHRLIAETFIGPRPYGMQIDHIDGNKRNNAARNLEYVTGGENIERAIKLGLIKRKYPKLKDAQPLIVAIQTILNDPDNTLTDASRRIALEALTA